MKKKVIALVSNNIATDQRLIKIGTSLQNNGYDFLLVGVRHRGNPDLAHIPFITRRLSLFFQSNFLFYTELQIRFFLYLLFKNKKDSILLANDLDTLLPAFLVSKLFGIPLIFDSHEIFSELPSLNEGSIQKKVWKALEKNLLPKLKFMYTVSESYANFFKTEYDIQPKIIKNVPFFGDQLSVNGEQQPATSNQQLATSNEQQTIIYQGAINYSRGIDKMILAMKYLENVQLWIVGDGPYFSKFQQLAKDEGLTKKIKFYGRVTPSELKKITPQADVGLSLEEDNGLSYRYALPNKMFDYMHAEIPILGSHELPEIERIITQYNIGLMTESHEPQQIAEKIEELLKLGKAHFKENLKKAAAEFNWENQEAQLLSIFDEASSHK